MSSTTWRNSVGLRPVRPSDHEDLRRIEMADIGPRWRLAGTTPSPQMYAARLWSGVLEHRVVFAPDSGETIGLVTAYDADARNGVAYLAAVSSPAHVGTGRVVAALGLFITYLFREWPFRRLYLDTTSDRLAQFGSAVGPVLTHELTLSGTSGSPEGPTDRAILSIERETWLTGPGRYLRQHPAAAPRSPVYDVELPRPHPG